jgi:predicted ATP-dependent protease
MATNGHDQDGNSKHWQVLYCAALQELSIDKLPHCIRDAQKEITDEIERSNGFQTDHQPLLDALSALRDLEQISQAFPVYASGQS